MLPLQGVNCCINAGFTIDSCLFEAKPVVYPVILDAQIDEEYE